MAFRVSFCCWVTLFLVASNATAQQLLPKLPGAQPITVKAGVALKPLQHAQQTVNGQQLRVASIGPNQSKEITRTIDLRETIAKLARIGNLTTQQARLETLQFLALTPRLKSKRGINNGSTFELVDVDRFEITAGEEFFESLPGKQQCLEAGKIHVVVSSQIVLIPIRKVKRLNAFLAPETTQVISSVLPPVVPVATSKEVFGENATTTFATTSTITRETAPVTTGVISKENHQKLQAYLRSESAQTLTAPKVMMYPNQVAAISEVTQHPFVVGLERASESRSEIVQPIVQLVEEGTTIRVRPVIRGDKIQLYSDISFSKILDVKTLNFASAGERQQQSIQIPQQKLRQVHLSALLTPDTTLLIDPHFIHTVASDTHGRKSESMKIVILMQAKAMPLSQSDQFAEEEKKNEIIR